MANRLFRRYVQHLMTGGSLNLTSADIRCALVDVQEHDPDTAIAGDEFLDDISAGVVDTTGALQNKTVVDGVFDADNIELPDTEGDTAEELVIYNHTGTASNSRLLACIDDATGLPIARDGVADEIQFHASGIFEL